MKLYLLCAVVLCSLLCCLVVADTPQATTAASSGPTRELTRYFEKVLSQDADSPEEEWCFGVVADPHIYMYAWNDGSLANRLRGWAAARAKFGVAVGDLGTGKSLRADGDAQTRQMDKFAKTIASVPNCPPVVVSMGNHELDGDGKKAWLDALYPGVVEGITGSGNDRYFYYSFNYRGCHFVSLDANMTGKRRRRRIGVLPEEQFAWLEKDLRANKGRLTFVFLHEPIEQLHYDTPYYLLKNRGRLIALLRRHPDVKWIFHGHLHYDDHVKAWGLNIVHANMGNLAVRVKGQQAHLCRITPKGLVPTKGTYDLGKELAKRRTRESGLMVYRIAEDALEKPGRNCSLKKHARLVAAEEEVQPTHGKTMLKISRKLEARESRSFTHLHRYMSTVDVIPIRKGMKFSYDVRCENSVYDNFALQLRIAMPAGRKRLPLKDQNGISMDNIHQYRSPSLGSKADGKWYRRECDLSELAGGWIDMITLYATRPNNAPYPAGQLKMYVDNIRFTWPEDGEKD